MSGRQYDSSREYGTGASGSGYSSSYGGGSDIGRGSDVYGSSSRYDSGTSNLGGRSTVGERGGDRAGERETQRFGSDIGVSGAGLKQGSGGDTIPIKRRDDREHEQQQQQQQQQRDVSSTSSRDDRGSSQLATQRERGGDVERERGQQLTGWSPRGAESALSLLDPFGSSLLSPFGGFGLAPFGGLFDSAFRQSQELIPNSDWNETEKNFLLTVDVPGIPKDQVRVDVKGRRLTVSGEKKEETSDEWSSSRSVGKFSRTMSLPHNADVDNIDARIDHGQLKVMIPKMAREKMQKRDIRVQ